MKASLFYFRLTYLNFLDSLEIQANQGNIHPTLTIQKVALALKNEKSFSDETKNIHHF